MDLFKILVRLLAFDFMQGCYSFRNEVKSKVAEIKNENRKLTLRETSNGFNIVIAQNVEIVLYEYQHTIFLTRIEPVDWGSDYQGHQRVVISTSMVPFYLQGQAHDLYCEVLEELTKPS